ncbi:sugar ABC transporter ATP-binding protein [Pseudogemmobacter faecipullorum]|uniref:Sugar ABC transporter ATP-binding protein n=1 Tax=Pseudogemmobacter faecipullorum TaxID=2755041 RepID=A0ABS8CQ01_9RHOB|nr:sugar ABC transporter ATP-binding protein [Pseudogemmobacter faecipullorum]MCB5410915.1 sugar ABC transporter ATP-binding protein [Pseudogemmobacter faecipullorum]
MQPVLEMRNVSKTFGSVTALSNVQLSLYPGEIHALMGENGAGKSTLMKILSGAYRPDAGAEILIDGQPVQITGPISARAAGVSIIYQELALSPNLSVAENIFLGRELARGGVLRRAEMQASAAPVLRRLGANFAPSTIVGTLNVANQQLVEIARALHADSRILIMDEPTTALSERETEGLFSMIRQLRSEGLAIVYISHRMNEVYELADRVSILRDGSYAGTLNRAEASPDAIVKRMVGRELSSLYTKTSSGAAKTAAIMLKVRDLSDGRRVHGCSFDLRAGEVVGLAGLVGSGRSELAQAVFGARPRKAGEMWLEGKAFAPQSPQDAIAARVAYLTEDRRGDGLFLDMSCEENINTGVLRDDARWGMLLNRSRARERANESIRSLAVRVPNASFPVGGLSGGNQQKVLLSRWLQIRPRVLILDEPTRGVDIGAKSEIYRIIDALAREGVAILVISSELPEVIGVSDRILVMHEGRISGEVGGESGIAPSQENIMAFASGVGLANAA